MSEKNKGGRPTKYDPAFCEKIIELGKDGASKAEMCLELGIGHSAWYDYIEKHPEFSEAVKEAHSLSQGWWEREGRRRAFDSNGFSATAYIFQMKNRFPDDWRDKKEIDQNLTATHAHVEISEGDDPKEALRKFEEFRSGAANTVH